MREKKEMLEVVDENDVVIGLESRERIHREGLLHREANVLFITPQGAVIFQHRSKNKDTYPDKLATAVGGHVEPGMSYELTAITECREEAGLQVRPEDLRFLGKFRKISHDASTGRTNNVWRAYYAFLFKGRLQDLHVEAGKSEGFEAWPIARLPQLSLAEANRFAATQLSTEYLEFYHQAQKAFGVV